MAARKRKLKLSDDWKAKIQASMLVNRLSNHVAGEIELSATQVQAANILLKKVIPDQASTTLAGDPEKPLKQDITVTFVKPAN